MGRGDYWPSTGFWPRVNECRVQAIDFSQIKGRIRGIMTNAAFQNGHYAPLTRTSRRTKTQDIDCGGVALNIPACVAI
jgi:hypothetical protein